MKNLMTITLNELKRDGITAEKLQEMPESDRQNMILSYAQAAQKRFDHFATKYASNKQARDGFRKFVAAII